MALLSLQQVSEFPINKSFSFTLPTPSPNPSGAVFVDIRRECVHIPLSGRPQFTVYRFYFVADVSRLLVGVVTFSTYHQNKLDTEIEAAVATGTEKKKRKKISST